MKMRYLRVDPLIDPFSPSHLIHFIRLLGYFLMICLMSYVRQSFFVELRPHPLLRIMGRSSCILNSSFGLCFFFLFLSFSCLSFFFSFPVVVSPLESPSQSYPNTLYYISIHDRRSSPLSHLRLNTHPHHNNHPSGLLRTCIVLYICFLLCNTCRIFIYIASCVCVRVYTSAFTSASLRACACMHMHFGSWNPGGRIKFQNSHSRNPFATLTNVGIKYLLSISSFIYISSDHPFLSLLHFYSFFFTYFVRGKSTNMVGYNVLFLGRSHGEGSEVRIWE
ncbi:hypothetical protein M413DRAFT_252761 [Hebeloma cylindrosporum]|uniref:Uncharacterized protein n=1 Tax=Hebeloma cylindrosporum TaxID=76867 RepID=A0A0C3BMJ7_HEBCY|nr:hypothetical protein M413DRAFT_252761 [Hebeloma cylindrosporum h7]